MLNSVDKELVKNRFGKSLLTYDKNAIVQKHMASELLAAVIRFKGNNFDKILEIGCGTGFLSKEILEQIYFNKLFANDIVDESVNKIRLLSEKVTELCGDCEHISFPTGLDLVISNATFQWIENFVSLTEKINSCLNKEGIFAFSTFEKQNLYQIKTITGKSLNYYAKSEIENILSGNLKILFSHTETINVEFESVHEILKHLKLSGVNSLGPTKWTKSNLKDFEYKYNKFFRNNMGKLILTYKPMYFICAKINF